MSNIVALVGVLVVLICGYSLVRLEPLKQMADAIFDGKWLYLAALARLLLGAVFIAAAPDTRMPLAVEVLGWLMCFGGVLLVSVPRGVWQGLIDRVMGLPGVFLRLFMVMGTGIGVFLIWVSAG